jgi:hypothetical protein
MKCTRFRKITVRTAATVLTVLAVSLMAGGIPASAQNGRNGQIHIVKDCREESGIPGSDFCTIVTSNLRELPAGTRIYYDLSAGPSAGPGYFDQNIFVFVNTSQWGVGRCTGPNNIGNTPGTGALCTLSDGFGPLAGFTARLNVTHIPQPPRGNAFLYAWDGTYSFNPLPGR